MSCPHCKKADFNGAHCRFCGCTAMVNPASGNTIYMIRGRVVAAPDDLARQTARREARDGKVVADGLGADPLDLRDQKEE